MDNTTEKASKSKKKKALLFSIIAVILVIGITYAAALIYTKQNPNFGYKTSLYATCQELGFENVKVKASVRTVVHDEFTRFYVIEAFEIDGKEYNVLIMPEISKSGADKNGNMWVIEFPSSKERTINWFGLTSEY